MRVGKEIQELLRQCHYPVSRKDQRDFRRLSSDWALHTELMG